MGGDKGSISRLSVCVCCVCAHVHWYARERVCFKCRNRSLTNGSAEGGVCICQRCLKHQRRVNLSKSLHLVFDQLAVFAPSASRCWLWAVCPATSIPKTRLKSSTVASRGHSCVWLYVLQWWWHGRVERLLCNHTFWHGRSDFSMMHSCPSCSDGKKKMCFTILQLLYLSGIKLLVAKLVGLGIDDIIALLRCQY